MDDFESLLETLNQHLLDAGHQNWLLGAGISYDANIPLMFPLTDRVCQIVNAGTKEKPKEILNDLKKDLESDSHVEHYLSHLGDLIAIAERSRAKIAFINSNECSLEQLIEAYVCIITAIGNTVRYGYKSENTDNDDPERIGTAELPIVEINHHNNFVEALFSNRINLERRSKINFFTTNYDTLLEDALALRKKVMVDGFSGGAVGFWNPEQEFTRAVNDSNTCLLYKLHGSIDWYRDKEKGLVRARYGTKYLSAPENIMIYPQATKYVEAQKDPFAFLFAGLRSALMSHSQNVLITCGYSFGDEHINTEIETALASDGNKTTVVAFTSERPESEIVINSTLDRWLNHPKFGERVFVAGKSGLYNNSITPILPDNVQSLNWCRFSGLTQFLKTGDY